MFRRFKEVFLTNWSVRQTVFKNVFWLGVGQVGGRLLRALVIIYAARVLGAAEYGVFAYALGLAAFFSVFADLGVNTVLTRETAKHREEEGYHLVTSLAVKSTLLVLTAVLVFFAVPYLSKIELTRGLLLSVAFLMVFDGTRDCIAAYFRGKEKMEKDAVLGVTTNAGIILFGLIILYTSASAENLAVTYVLGAGAGALLGAFMIGGYLKRARALFKSSLIPRIFASSLPIALISVVSTVMLQADVLMIGYFKEATDVGLYSAGQRVVQFLYVLSVIMANVMFPVFSRYAGVENERNRRFVEQSVTASLLVAIPIALGGAILAGGITQFLFGVEYLPGAAAFQILLFTVLTTFPGVLIGNYILAYEQQKKVAIISVVSASANIVLNMILIPTHGILGAAIATLISQVLYLGLGWRLAKKVNDFRIWRRVGRILAASAVMGVIVFLLQAAGSHVVLTVGISGAAYILLLFLFKEPVLKEGVGMLSFLRRGKEGSF